ncbi:hypothetical protein ACWCXB_28315 [Streptomyces sp. NPDC001514]
MDAVVTDDVWAGIRGTVGALLFGGGAEVDGLADLAAVGELEVPDPACVDDVAADIRILALSSSSGSGSLSVKRTR